MFLTLIALILSLLTPHHAPAPDITYAPCSWFNTGHVIPAYTYTDRCIDTAGHIVKVVK
jgi:hypothetical protein